MNRTGITHDVFLTDPTYAQAEIQEREDWALAFWLSEQDNNNAPLGWSQYIPLATALLRKFDLTTKDGSDL